MHRRVSPDFRNLIPRLTVHNLLIQCTTTAPFCTSSMPPAGASSSRFGPPIKVLLTDSAGRGVFSTRIIADGELIHTAKPLLTHPSLAFSDRACYYCLRQLNIEYISSGREETDSSFNFCSEECRDESKGFYKVERKVDWSPFHDYCRTQGLKYPLMVKRLACMVVSGVVSADVLDVLQPANLAQEAVSQMEEEFKMLKCSLWKAEVDEKLMLFLTKQWYVGVLARIRINAFRIELVTALHEDLLASAIASVASEASVGNAVYMLPSFYNHDCDPNTHIVWIDCATAKLKALRQIEEGEELRICYLDASMDHDARQQLLFEGFGFRCRCLRCSSGD